MEAEEALKQSLVKNIRRRTAAEAHTRTLIHIQDSHYKFYQVTVNDTTVITQYGRIGTFGNPGSSVFLDETEAIKAAGKIIDNKLKMGYEEPTMVYTAEKPVKKPKKLTPEGVEKLNAFLLTLT